ncbi:hypothetical protein AB0K09_23410 [Streptomyces sp. NPDC049577]|uniref:hypothetical protein n=1 Tax=Streptomyces sp. NPDC049577 TaxID=3155153 RepID=UPI00342A533C
MGATGEGGRLPPGEETADRASPVSLARGLVGQASVIAGLMFYLGVVYTTAYYGYFHISPFTLGFGFSEFVLESLTLLRNQVMVTAVIALLVFSFWPLLLLVRTPGVRQHTNAVSRFLAGETRVAKAAGVVLASAGLVVLVGWRWLRAVGWIAPLAIAAGLLLSRRLAGKGRAGARRAAIPVLAAAICLFWAATLFISHLGERDAAAQAKDITRLTGVLVLSNKRLSIPYVHEEDLGPGRHYRYRYTDLRRVAEGQYGYYVVPLTWDAGTDPVYLISRSSDTWIGLTPGMRYPGGSQRR